MKFTKSIIMAAGLGLAALTARADVGFTFFANAGTAVNLGTNDLIVPMQSVNGGTPVLTFLALRAFSGSAANSTLTSYYSTNKTTITATNAAGLERTNIVASTNGFAAGQLVVWQHLQLAPRNQYERLKVTTIQNTNQIVFDTAPASPCQVSDAIFQETAGATIIPTSTTSTATTFTGPAILAGQREIPWLLEIASSGSGTNTIDGSCIQFISP